MKLPGVATLDFEVEKLDGERARLTQTARFQPQGLFGILYWYGVLPLHSIVFAGMLHGLKKAAEENRKGSAGGPIHAENASSRASDGRTREKSR
jgi:hypothetical protein